MRLSLKLASLTILMLGVSVGISTLITSSAYAATSCADVLSPLPSWITDRVTNNKPFYLATSSQTGVPWEMLASIHYRETNFSHTNPSNGQGIFQFVNGNGGPYPPGPVSDDNFQQQLNYMAGKIQSDYIYRGSLNYNHRPLTPNEADDFRIQDTLFSYNGRSSQYAQQGTQYGFMSDVQPYEGSPYVMNMFDCTRMGMGIITRDYGSIDGIDTRYGAYTLYTRLKGDDYWKSRYDWLGGSLYGQVIMRYKSHLSGIGWTNANINRGVTGTTGQSRPMEAFRVDGEMEYSSYSYTTGWQPTVNNGMISGTIGQSRAIQAIKINPTGSLASKYDVYYRTHVSNIGWMGWAKNGAVAGVTGQDGRNIEAFETLILPKDSNPPGAAGDSYQNIDTISYSPPLSLSMSSHVSDAGWQPNITDTMVSGTTEQSRRIEAVKISLTNNTGLTGDVVYSSHISGVGWQDIKSHGQVSGTTGKAMQMEAIRIALTDQLNDNYDVWYRGHIQDIGWLGWAKNGYPTGSVGVGRQLEAVEIRLAPKNSTSLSQQNNFYNPKNWGLPDNYSLFYSAHVSGIGWMINVPQNSLSGTTGQSRNIEAIRIDNSNSLSGPVSVTCSAYVKSAGWMENISPGNTCGTTGQLKPIEAVKLKLAVASDKYDIYYKVHLSHIGWQDWKKNDEQAGTPLSNNPIEALVIKLVQK